MGKAGPVPFSWFILILWVLLILNLPINGKTLAQRIKSGTGNAAQYAQERAG